jgi:ribosomal protein S16
VVLQEHTVAPGGKHVEVLGSYDPYSKKAVLKNKRIQYWIGHGAQLSDTAHNLLVREGVLVEKKRSVKMPKPAVKEVPVVAEAKADQPATLRVAMRAGEESAVVSAITPAEKKEEKVKEA